MAKKGSNGDGPLTPEVIPPPKQDASARNRAYRISKAIKDGASVPPEDLAWYTEYEHAKQSRAAHKSKKVSFTSEETEASAEGNIELAAALAAPQLAREEGRRIDALIREATNATAAAHKSTLSAFELVLKFASAILDRNGKLETNNIGMLETFRKSHIELTHAHAALIEQQAEHDADEITRAAEDASGEQSDMVEGIVQQFLPLIVGEMQKRAAAKKGDG